MSSYVSSEPTSNGDGPPSKRHKSVADSSSSSSSSSSPSVGCTTTSSSSSFTDSQSKSSPSTLNQDDKGHDDTATIKRLTLENKELIEKLKEFNTTKEQLNTAMEQLKKRKEEEEQEEEEGKKSFKCCSHIDDSGWTTKLSPNDSNAYHNEDGEWCGEPVHEIAYQGSIGYQCGSQCMMTYKPLCEDYFTLLCAACEEEEFNPKICKSCYMKESECDGVLDGEGICQECTEAIKKDNEEEN